MVHGVIPRRSFLRFLGIALLSGAMFLPGPALRAVEPLPASIEDSAFWRMIQEFSEDGGLFLSDNFTSNESGYQSVIPQLQTLTRPGGVYLGVGPEQNFTYVAELQPAIAFIIDIRRQNMIQHLMYKAAFEMSASRADLLSLLFSRKKPDGLGDGSTVKELFDAYSQVMPDFDLMAANFTVIRKFLTEENPFTLSLEDDATLYHVFSNFARFGPDLSYGTNSPISAATVRRMPTYAELMLLDDGQGINRSYLASEENYRRVRDMQKRNLVIPLVGNFAGDKTIRAIGQYLKDHEAAVSVFYASNVEQYLFEDQTAGEFYKNMATLPMNPSSMLIRTTNGGASPKSVVGARDFHSLVYPIPNLLKAFASGEIQQYLDLLFVPFD